MHPLERIESKLQDVGFQRQAGGPLLGNSLDLLQHLLGQCRPLLPALLPPVDAGTDTPAMRRSPAPGRRVSAGETAEATPPPTRTVMLPTARVIRVNPTYRYVILECTVLPTEGEEARVYRKQDMVGTARITSRRHGPFVAAEILEGDPQRGDTVKLKRRVPTESQEEEAP